MCVCGAALRAGSLLAGNGELLTPIIRWDKHVTSQGRGTWREVGTAAGAPSQDGPPMRRSSAAAAWLRCSGPALLCSGPVPSGPARQPWRTVVCCEFSPGREGCAQALLTQGPDSGSPWAGGHRLR